MSLEPGTSLGSYSVTAKIGEGGMGEVYRARDTKLDRDVALKVLPQAFTDDPDRLARFEREAKVLASLNHPNIGGIHGLEESDGVRALVLEYIDGPTLADRIAQGPIPIDEALPIAKQIAEALEAAHEQGIIHRDLKPANVKVKLDGTVKVLDFGLAKALDTTPEGDPSLSPTLTAAATQMGVIMGTAAYMSPEQAAGKTADKRSDIWSFGVVLFEMVTGQRLFTGETVAHVMAKVLDRELDLSVLPTTTPAPIKRLLRRCLERSQKRRLGEAGEVFAHLEEAATAAPEALSGTHHAPVVQPAGWRQVHPTALGISAVAFVVGGLAVWTFMQPGSPLPTRFPLGLPPEMRPGSVQISPDARSVFFQGQVAGENHVYTRALDQLGAVALPGTVGAAGALDFSPDGEWLLFADFREYPRLLKRMPLAGGPAVTIAQDHNWDVAWKPDDTIVQGSRGGLLSVSVSRGEPVQLTTISEGEMAHVRPRLLPSGRAVLFHVFNGFDRENQVALYDFDTGETRNLFPGSSPQFVASGHLVYWREGSLWGVSFDPDNLEVTGEPVPIEDNVFANGGSGWSPYAVADSGLLVYWSAGDGPVGVRRSLLWVDREGNEEPLPLPVRPYSHVRLSPNGQRVAIGVGFPVNDIEIYDLVGARSTPLTFDPMLDQFPIWTPDGDSIVFASDRHGGQPNAYRKAADGSGEPEPIALNPEEFQIPSAVSSDGSVLVTQTRSEAGGTGAIGAVSIDGADSVEWLVASEAQEEFAVLSPDGRWMAYVSGESGQLEVYVTPYPNVGDDTFRVSSNGGVHPFWGPDNDELFYATHRAENGELVTIMAVEIESDPTFTPGTPRSVVEGRYRVGYSSVDMDGERFLMIKEVSEPSNAQSNPPQLIVVENWVEELKERVPIP